MSKRTAEHISNKLHTIDQEYRNLQEKRRKLRKKLDDAKVRDILPDCFHKLVDDNIISRLRVKQWKTGELGGTFWVRAETIVCGQKQKFSISSGTGLDRVDDPSTTYESYIDVDDETVFSPRDKDGNRPKTLQEAWTNVLGKLNEDVDGDDLIDTDDPKIFSLVLLQIAVYCYCMHYEHSIREVFNCVSLDGIKIPSFPPADN